MDAIKKLAIILLFCSKIVNGQTTEKETSYRIGEISIDLIGNYYEQSGNHSAVEGGQGDQALENRVGGIQISVPVDSIHIITADISADAYTSASSSQIDWNDDPAISSPSYEDTRVYGHLSYARILKNGDMYSLGAGLSNEWDVFSHSYNVGYQKSFRNNNLIVNGSIDAIFDNWDLIYPTDIESNLIDNETGLTENIRKTLGFTTGITGIITKTWQVQVVYNYTHQWGLLSTPYHRIIFDTAGMNIPVIEGDPIFGDVRRHPFVQKDIERLPYQKSKHAIGIRSSWYVQSWLIMRSFYRFYTDDFDITAHTASIELPIKPTRFISITPFYRYYAQTASTYFKPMLEHTPDNEFYTSDYDLSAFSSVKYGLGFKLSPPKGIISYYNYLFQRSQAFKAIEIRAANYERSDGLKAMVFTGQLSFTL